MKTTSGILSLILTLIALTIVAQPEKQESPNLLEVARFDHYQPIGVAVTAKGRIFVTFPHRQPYKYGLVELIKGKQVPYPDQEWNTYDSLKTETHFTNTQAVWPDDENHLWVLDPSGPGNGTVIASGRKLLNINLITNKVMRVYRFEDLSSENMALNDVRIDTKHRLAYLSEPKTASIIVLDLTTGRSRMVLKEDKSTTADPNFKLHLDGKNVMDITGQPFSSNVNGIALTRDFKWLYFRAINQTKLYRISTEDLSTTSLSASKLSQKVQTIEETGVSHGMVADKKGNIYLTDSPNKAIRYVTPEGQLKLLIQDKRLIWPDTLSPGNDGYLYITCSQINRDKRYNNGEDKAEYPYRLYKVKLPN